MMNNIGVLGGANENNIYGAFLNYMDAPTGGQCFVNGVVARRRPQATPAPSPPIRWS